MDETRAVKVLKASGIAISRQALNIFMSLDNREVVLNDIINQVKTRQFIISGGDMLQYVLKKRLSTSLILSEDIANGK